MLVQLAQLVTDTIFWHDNMDWKKGSNTWVNPTKSCGATPDIVGKHCVKCYPKLGGKFQDHLGRWIPMETEVSVN